MSLKRGRPANLDPKRRINVHVREDLFCRFTLLNFNEATRRAKYGTFSDFVNEALKEYITITENKGKYLEDRKRIEAGWKEKNENAENISKKTPSSSL